jgi:hypothetical protein
VNVWVLEKLCIVESVRETVIDSASECVSDQV